MQSDEQYEVDEFDQNTVRGSATIVALALFGTALMLCVFAALLFKLVH